MRIGHVIIILLAVILTGCGGGSPNSSLWIAPSSVTIAPGDSVSFSAGSLYGSYGDDEFCWSGAAGGYLNSTTGSSVTFTAGSIEGDYELHLTRSDMPGKVGVAVISIHKDL